MATGTSAPAKPKTARPASGGRSVKFDAMAAKGHDEMEAVKTQAAHRWVSAVNADGAYGEWRYEIVHDMNAIPALLDGI